MQPSSSSYTPPKDRLSMANEDYLEAIYRIMIEHATGVRDVAGVKTPVAPGVEPEYVDITKLPAELQLVRSVDVAELLNVSKASVNKAITMLKDHGYVEQQPYGRVALTPEGQRYARWVWRAHRALRKFLTHDLGIAPATADEEACRMEHTLSSDTINRWVAYLEQEGVTIED
jgi:Mn-dependent DtxR family transcriptional regulator